MQLTQAMRLLNALASNAMYRFFMFALIIGGDLFSKVRLNSMNGCFINYYFFRITRSNTYLLWYNLIKGSITLMLTSVCFERTSLISLMIVFRPISNKTLSFFVQLSLNSGMFSSIMICSNSYITYWF